MAAQQRKLPRWFIVAAVLAWAFIAGLWLESAGVLSLGWAPPRNPPQWWFVLSMMTLLTLLGTIKHLLRARRLRDSERPTVR